MNIDEYQEFTQTTNLVKTIAHVLPGLSAEAGEVAACYQKFARGDYGVKELRNRLEKEVGGLLWYISELCNMEGINLSNVLTKNRDQLIDRQNRGKLQGDGDDR